MKNYDEIGVVRSFKKVNHIKVNIVTKTISINKNANIGNGTSGKIDYLCNYCGYTKTYVDGNMPNVKQNDDIIDIPKIKHNIDIDIVSKVKQNIKKSW